MSLIGNPDTPETYVADYMQACVGLLAIPPGGFTADIEAFGAATSYNVEELYAALLNGTIGRSIYAPGSSNATFAAKLITNAGGALLSDDLEAACVDFVKQALDGGMSRAAIAMQVVEVVAGLDTADADLGPVAQQFANRIEIANYYTFASNSPSSTLSTLTAVLSGVSNTTDVSDPEAYLDSVTDPGVSTGQTYTLTTSADSIIGTTGNDTINGAIDDNTAASNTFTVLDTINGGTGTDTLNVTIDASGGGISFPAAAVSNVEIFNFRNVSGQTLTIDTNMFAGETTVASDRSSNQVDITNIASGVTVGVIGDGSTTNGTLNLTYASTATAATLAVSGGTTAGAINLKDSGTGTVAAVTITSAGTKNTVGAIDLDGDAGGTKVTSLTVDAATNLTTGNITNFAASSTITVKGAATLVTLGTLEDTNVTKLDASGMTAGGVKATLNNVTTISVTGGTGNDSFTTGAVITGTGKVDGGAGTDTLTIAASAHLTADTGKLYTNFETLGVASGGVTVDLDHISGITAIEVTDANADAAVVNDMTATQAANITIKGYGGAATFAVKGADTVGQLDTVKLTFNDGDTTTNESLKDTTVLTATLADIETLQIHAVDAVEMTQSAATSGDLSKIELTGAGDITLVTGNIATINMIIDGSAGTGKQVIDASAYATNGVAIKVGTGSANTITGSAQADVFTLNTGKDTIMTLNGDTVNSFTGGTGGDVIDVSGTGNAALGTVHIDTDSTVKVRAATTTDAAAITDNDILFVSVAEAASLDTQAEIALLFGAGKVFEAFATSEEATLLIAAADTGKVYVYNLEESGVNTSIADVADTVALVGTLNGVSATQLDTWVAANFQA